MPSGLLGLHLLLRTDPLILALTVTSDDLPGTSDKNESQSFPRHRYNKKSDLWLNRDQCACTVASTFLQLVPRPDGDCKVR